MVKVLIIQCIILGLLSISSGATPLNNEKAGALNVAVIGAGPSGLVSAKYALEQGFKVTVFEQGEEVGGIWVYTDKVGKDKYGNKIHTAMYKGLRTNSPIYCMEFKDHHYPKDTNNYPTSNVVLKFLQSYADRFNLRKYIKFSHQVIRVVPLENDKWEVLVKDLPNNKYESKIYDAVFVCNGHFTSPRTPVVEGAKKFRGKLMHSHDFRTSDTFRGEEILVIGGGSSGTDLVTHLSGVARRLTLSTKKMANETKEERARRRSLLPKVVTLKDNVRRFTPNGAEFIDGTRENYTVIFFATGYQYSYPFLSVDSGIHVTDNFIQPLYKQVFNIDHPTMAFIGVPTSASNFMMFDLQARFAMKFISGEKKMPSKYDMLNDMWTQTENHWNKGYRVHYSHYLGPEQKAYYKQLADTANIENIPDVIGSIHWDAHNEAIEDPSGYRNTKYTIIDDKTFIKERLDENSTDFLKQQ